MKKTIFLLSVLLSLCLVGCDNKVGPEKPEVNEYPVPMGAVGLKALSSEYNLASNLQISGATHSFLLMFATEECEVIEGTPFGAEGIYKIEEAIQDGSITAGFDMMGVPIGAYVQNMVDDVFVSHDFIVSGAVEIKKGKADDEVEVFVYAVFEDGSEANYYYGGKLLITDYSVEE